MDLSISAASGQTLTLYTGAVRFTDIGNQINQHMYFDMIDSVLLSDDNVLYLQLKFEFYGIAVDPQNAAHRAVIDTLLDNIYAVTGQRKPPELAAEQCFSQAPPPDSEPGEDRHTEQGESASRSG